jgi:SIR2-like domain
MYVLQEQIVYGENTADMFKQLSIINFNYDRCIEQFFFYALQNLYQMNEGQAAELLNANLRIYHPYGSLGVLPWQVRNNENSVPFGGSEYGDDLNLIADEIKTFNEQLEDDGLVKKLGEEISQAERIVFLGFHFHPQNMQLLASSKPARGGTVEIFATALQRSKADLNIIDSQIREMLNERAGSWNIHLHSDMDCVALFKEYATTLTY